MIKWCSYCRRYMHECEPWEDYRISHGICPACFRAVLADTAPDLEGFREIKEFFGAMQELARDGTRADVGRILQESRRLRIPAMDLLLGILQPLLVEIGELWAAGRVSVAAEHRFSALVAQLMAELQDQACGEVRLVPPRLLLFGTEGNDHHLGLRMAEYFFLANGIPTLAVLPGIPLVEALDLIATWKPQAVGFSVALAAQMRQVRAAAGHIRALPTPPAHILVGGPAVRLGLDPDAAPALQLCRQLNDVLPSLRPDLSWSGGTVE